jgi:predicted heme/steroid binding protein
MIQTVEKIYSYNGFSSYKIIFTDGRVYSVPLDPANTDYQEIQKWISEGGTVIDNGGNN